tara:strand:+ start:2502 stop:3677 length:1176 start_codon:yes stop_codon:yes gene_type:complete
MKYLSGSTNGEWIPLEPNEEDEDEEDVSVDYESNRRKVEKALTDLLTAERLVVLTGLGTSLCVTDEDGDRLAPTMDDLWNATKDATGDAFEQTIEAVGYNSERNDIELLLSRCQMYERFHEDTDVADFVLAADKRIAEECRFVDDTVDLRTHEDFLRKVARRSPRLPRMQLFTTNYDLCYEVAASRSRFIVIDGFSHTLPQEFDGTYFSYDIVRRDADEAEPLDFISNVFHLHKLHGSIDWEQSGGRIRRVQQTDQPVIIYPRESKFELSYNQPFLEQMSRLQAALRGKSVALLVIGFGFNDLHISQPILTALRSNVHLRMLAVSPSLEDTAVDTKDSAVKEIARFAMSGDQRIGMLTATFEELVRLLPQLVARTEEESHFDRISDAGETP